MHLALISLLLVLILAWLAGKIANRLGFPAILGELAAGIIFGPALLGVMLFPESWPIIGGKAMGFASMPLGLPVLAEVGVFLLMLYIGMEVDYRDLFKAKWAGLAASIGGFIVPFAVGYWLARMFGFRIEGGLFLGLAMGVTSIATKSRILVDLNLFGTRLANVLLAGALISDTAVLIVFAMVLGIAGDQGLQISKLLMVTVKAVIFFALAIFMGRRLLPLIGALMSRGGAASRTSNFTLVLIIGLVYAEMAHLLGLHSVIGAFLAGMFLREGVLRRKLSHEISALVHDLSLGFLAPIFFVMAGFHVSFSVVIEMPGFVGLVLVLATVSKIVGTLIFYVISGHPWREGLVIGAGMNGRGAVEIIIAEIALSMGLISQEIFSTLVIMAFATTLTVPILLKVGTDWLRRRNELSRMDEDRRGIVFIGATPLARLLASRFLAAAESEPVCLIESNRDRCIAARNEGLQVIRGNALEEETLDSAGARDARLLLAMTSNSEVNTVAAQLARDFFAVPQILTVNAGLAPEGAPQETPEAGGNGGKSRQPLHFFSRPVALDEWNKRIIRKECEIQSLPVSAQSDSASKLAAEMLGTGLSLPLLVERGGALFPPAVLNDAKPGDILHYLTQRQSQDLLADRFDQIVQDCPILDLDGAMNVEQLFERVADTMSPRLGVDAAHLKELLMARERESTTVIVPGLAIPHVILDGEKRFDMLIVRCREGVRFLDADAAANMVFVLFGSRDDRNMHLRVLSIIAQFMQDSSFERRWLEAESPAALRAVVQKTQYKRG